MKARFKVGDTVMMTEDATAHYSELQGRDLGTEIFTVTHVAHNTSEHPGYDNGLGGEALYDLKTMDGKDFPCSLYDYELERG